MLSLCRAANDFLTGRKNGVGQAGRKDMVVNLCALSCLGLGLWLTLTVFFDLA